MTPRGKRVYKQLFICNTHGPQHNLILGTNSSPKTFDSIISPTHSTVKCNILTCLLQRLGLNHNTIYAFFVDGSPPIPVLYAGNAPTTDHFFLNVPISYPAFAASKIKAICSHFSDYRAPPPPPIHGLDKLKLFIKIQQWIIN